MYNNNLHIKTESFTINLDLHSIISVATGHSSTGKTFMIKLLERLKNVNPSKIIESNIDMNDIIMCRKKSDIDSLLYLHNDYKGKTIFIDRYDILHSKDLDNFILSGNNRIFLASHTFYDKLNLHIESLLLLNYNKDTKEFYTEPLLNRIIAGETI